MPGKKIYGFVRLSPAETTHVFDTYWRFATERQEIFFRKLEGSPPPWTRDPILRVHRFTNAYRASDRVSQYLIRNVIYKGDQSPEEVFFRIMLFKLFNRVATWELLQEKLGQLCYSDFEFSRYDTVLTNALAAGKRIYSAAYIMPAGRRYGRKHRGHLRLLEKMMVDEVWLRIVESRTMKQAFEILRSYPMIGDFLAYQFVIDINYSRLTNFSEMEFVMPGPGARDGMRKCFRHLGGLNEAEMIRLVAEHQEEEFAKLGLHFRNLWGRALQLVDCQNLFCEVGKYARAAHPEVIGTSGRRRIKQLYRPNPKPIQYWYPPKWGLNTNTSSAEV